MLESSGVTILGQRKLREVQKDGVVFDSNGTEEFHRADKTILALGFEPRTELRDALAKSNLGFDYYQVGDCIEPRDIFNAVQEGYEVGSKV
jgi:NADH dehydrogenase FAD-containing subunit